MKLFVDNLSNVDVSYVDAKRGLVGESWLVGLVLEGSLNNESMICDFGIVKRNAKKWLDTYLDHTLVVPTQMPGLNILESEQHLEISFPFAKGNFICKGPKEAFALLNAPAVKPEHLSPWVERELANNIPGQIDTARITMHTELIGGAFYHYSHGLKKHNGNCQRIAHGHRSKIEIFIQGARNPELEKEWAAKWKDIYIGTREDLREIIEIDGITHHHYQYVSAQGEFELIIPASCCYLIDMDTTVEQLAEHIAQTFKKQFPDKKVTIRAYEGVGKGAIAEYA